MGVTGCNDYVSFHEASTQSRKSCPSKQPFENSIESCSLSQTKCQTFEKQQQSKKPQLPNTVLGQNKVISCSACSVEWFSSKSDV